jgi:hypothetical protein
MWGRTELLIGPTTITLRRRMPGQRWSRNFDLAQVRGVRALPATGGIAFDASGKTYVLGRNLDAEARKALVDAIGRRVTPHIRPDQDATARASGRNPGKGDSDRT